MRPFQPIALRLLARPSLAPRLASRHVAKRPVSRPTSPLISRALSTTRALRNSQDQPGQVLVTTIKRSRLPKLSPWQRVITAIGAVIIVRFVLQWMAGEDEQHLEEELVESISEEDDQDLFIALQYPRRLPSKNYKPSDPEILEVEKYIRDAQTRQKVEGELSEHVCRHCAGNIALGNDVKISRSWFEIGFSASPPPEYARTGIEITQDYLALATQTIPHEQYTEISSILWPKAIFLATYRSMQTCWITSKAKTKKLCGLQVTNNEQFVLDTVQRLKIVKEMSNMHFPSEKDRQNEIRTRYTAYVKAMRAKEQGRAAEEKADSKVDSTSSNVDAEHASSKKAWTLFKYRYNGTTTSYILSLLPPAPVPTPEVMLLPLFNFADLELAKQVFVRSLKRSREEAKLKHPPKGTFLMSGIFDVIGSERGVRVRVIAIADLKTAQVEDVVSTVIQPMSALQWRSHRNNRPRE